MSRIKVEGELSLDGRGWEATLNKAERGINNLAHGTLGDLKSAIAGAFAFGALTSLISNTIQFAGHIGDTATRLGITTDAVQEFSYAAKQSGVDIDVVAGGLDKLAKAMEAAMEPGAAGDKMKTTLNAMGVSMEVIKSQNPADAFKAIGEKMQGMAVNSEVSANMMEIFGKSGTRLIPVLKELSENVEKAKSLGLIMDESQIKYLKATDDLLDTIGTKVKKLAGMEIAGVAAFVNGDIGEAIGTVYGGSDQQFQQGADKARIAAMEKTLESQRELKKLLDDNSKSTTVQPLTQTAKEKEKQDEEHSKLNEDTSKTEEKQRYDRLTTEQKIAEELQKQAEIKKALARLESQGKGGSFDAAQLKNQLVHSGDDLNALYEKKGKEGQAGAISKSSGAGADSITRVGNFLGTSGNAISNIGKKTNDLLTNIHGVLVKIQSNSGGLGVPL